MAVRPALAVLLLFIATVKADIGGVTFWRKNFTMTCPQKGNWFLAGTSIHNGSEYTQEYDNKKKGPYYCQYDDGQKVDQKYYFYVRGKVCEHCYELDATLFAMILIADVVATAAVMMIIYRCTKNKSSAGPTHTSKAPVRSGGQAPPVPSPDYEQLNTHTRSQDTYSMVNRTG